MSKQAALIAVDIGNARTKLGVFLATGPERLPEPDETLQIDNQIEHLDSLGAWLDRIGVEQSSWWIGSVNRPAATRLVDWLRERRPDDPVTLLSAADLGLKVEVARPDMVGVDRLLDALAASHLRRPGHPAVVVDVGTAITVDLVSADGAFRGGAILPGIAMSARALHEFTDLLPLVETSALTSPPAAVGTSTEQAMESGLFWGAVGSIRELIGQMTADASANDRDDAAEPDVFLTGGAGPAVAHLLGPSAHCVPQLTLTGILLAARAMASGMAER
ncbi:MAG: type III pantothenate kinase [Pirellulales bacterium]|nr:type III pantothenate kinase [Pirellulales bacterium]